jgi:hypothetical protein
MRQLLRKAAQNVRQLVNRVRRLIASHRVAALQPALPPSHTRFYHVYQLTQIECITGDLQSLSIG